MYIESEKVELKERFSDTLVKEIVTFLNTYGGTIYIGVKDDGTVVGIDHVDECFRKVSDIITDQIEPSASSFIIPTFAYDNNKTIIKIEVQKGLKPLYCIKKFGFSSSGCFIRIGSTCKPMSQDEIKNRYEKNFTDSDLMTKSIGTYGSLSFNTLKVYYTEKGYHLDDQSFENNLKLRTQEGFYNKLAELLSDNNMVPIIVVKFQGDDKTAISQRNNYGGGCLLFTYEKIKNRMASENICKSDTTVRPRIDTYLFDTDSVNEALVNALIHNDWNITQPLVSIFSNRIEILSHGGLPYGQTEELFFKGISKPRNDQLMRIFSDMNIAEHTGHGIPAIVKKYGKEAFEITDSYINVTILFNKEFLTSVNYVGNDVGIRVGNDVRRSNNPLADKIILEILSDSSITAKKLAVHLGFTQRTIERTIADLKTTGLLKREGTNRSGYWVVVK